MRVFVDRVETNQELQGDNATAGQGGVTSRDCSRLVRHLVVFFSAQGREYGLANEPEIEVSSPGINRHLRLESHFAEAVGERVRILVRHADNDANDSALPGSITGSLQQFADQELIVIDELTKDERRLPFAQVKKARIDFEF